MTTDSDYGDLVAKAEKAVAAVKDPELRRIAFQKILEDLLSAPHKPIAKAAYGHSTVHVIPRKSKPSGKGGPQAYVAELADDGFFKKPKTIAQVKAELENRGHHIALTSLSGPLQTLCQRKVLRRQKAAGSDKQKQTFAYSDW
jgi:hypothetical protein